MIAQFTSEYIQTLTPEECEQALNKINKKYSTSKPISVYTDEVDQVVNVILELEDKQHQIMLHDRAVNAANAKYTKGE